jgi:hypothetical protein
MIRRALAAAALAVVAIVVAVAPAAPAQARACRIDFFCTTTWFSDSTQTTVVGYLIENCVGDRFMSGIRGAAPIFEEDRC